MFNFILGLLLFINLWAPYLGSWFPPIAGAPSGAVLRDIISFLILIYALFVRLLLSGEITRYLVTPIIAWCSLCTWVFVLLIFSPNLTQAIMGARSYILFPSVFFVVLAISKSEKIHIKRCALLDFLLGLAVFASIIAILDVATLGMLKSLFGYKADYAGDNFALIDSYDGQIRATGGFSDALNFGYFLSICFLVGLQRYHETKNIYFIIASLVVFSCIVMTLTRGAIFCALLAMMQYSFFSLMQKNLIIKFFVSSVVLIFIGTCFYDIWYPYLDLMVERFTDSSSASKGSTMGRLTMAIAAINSLITNPIGVGLGTQGSGNIISGSDLRVNTDNYFFWMALETGVVGLLLNLFFLSACFFSAFLFARKNKVGLVRMGFLALMLLFYFLASMVSSAPSSSTFSIVFWSVFSLAVLDYRKVKNEY